MKADQGHLKEEMMAKSDALHKRMARVDTINLEANREKLEAVKEQ
jgi:hypothetical protein